MVRASSWCPVPAGGAGSVRLYDLTGRPTGSPQIDDYVVNVANYSPAANAVMQGNRGPADNGDCRVLGAFYSEISCMWYITVMWAEPGTASCTSAST